MAAGKREDSAEKSRAQQSRAAQLWWKQSHKAEEEEKGCLALPPGLHHRRDEDVGGEDSVVGAHEEEIQLDYRRIKCIFNHYAVFPDVTVRQPLKEELPSLSLSLLPLQLSGPTQYTADLAGVDMMAWTDILQLKKTKNTHTHTHHHIHITPCADMIVVLKAEEIKVLTWKIDASTNDYTSTPASCE